MNDFSTRTCAEINLDAIKNNVKIINGLLNGHTKIMAIVKADAYGHGAPAVARELANCGVDFFGVSNIDEAIQLRENGISHDILILGYTEPVNIHKLIKYDIIQTVFDIDYIKKISDTARIYNKKIRVHIKIDTGMNRLGFKYTNVKHCGFTLDEIEKTVNFREISAEGIYTHFACSDDKKTGFTELQFFLFRDLLGKLDSRGITFKIKHACNSGGCINFPQMHLDYVRCGIILYGLPPSKKTMLDGLLPAMQLKTVIAQIHEVYAGETVSYDRTYRNDDRSIRAATLPIGYADGFSRLFSNSSSVIVDGRKVPVIGRICMDQTVIDISECGNVAPGDTVTIFGEDKGERITASQLADMMETINYEVVCLIGKRVPRIYYRNGEEIGRMNYILL